jgi:uncharacterized protein YdaU (DUF1376 family)
MSERPFMQLYVSDFAGDTLTLTTEHIGAYLLLLIALWNADGQLDDDEEILAVTARLPIERWRVIWSRLSKFFEVGDGVVTHHRLTKELQRFARKSAARAEAGSRGGKAKALKDKDRGLAIATVLPQHLPDTRNKKAQSASDPTENLVVVVLGTPDFNAIEKLRNKKLGFLAERSGSITVPAAELAQARAKQSMGDAA